jgi:hypothetical protein
MMSDLASDVAQLRTQDLVDAGRLKAGGRHELETTLARWRALGVHARVVVLPRGTDPTPWRQAWQLLGLDEGRDLLLISDGEHTLARGWGLSRAQIDAALARARPGMARYLGRGLSDAVDALGAAATGVGPAAGAVGERPHSSVVPALVGGSLGAIAFAGLVAFVIHRRRRVAARSGAEFAAARSSAERAYADLMLAAEELGEGAAELQLRAAELKRRLDQAIAEGDSSPRRAADPVVLGRIRQLENELAALRSTVSQQVQAEAKARRPDAGEPNHR